MTDEPADVHNLISVECILSPTIIDDLTDPEFKSRVLAIFYAAMPVAAARGYVAGGQLEHLFGWRSAFYLVGMPVLVLALLVLLIEEPARRTATEDTRHTGFLVGRLLAIPTYCDAVLGYIAYTFALGAFAAWTPKYLEERLSLPLHTADLWLGTNPRRHGFHGDAARRRHRRPLARRGPRRREPEGVRRLRRPPPCRSRSPRSSQVRRPSSSPPPARPSSSSSSPPRR